MTLIRRGNKYLFWEMNDSYLKNLESPSTKDALCQIKLKLTQWFWSKRLLKFDGFLYFVKTFSWTRTLFISTNLSPLNQLACVPSLCWNWTSGSWEKDEKFTSDNKSDDWRQAIRKAHMTSRSGEFRTLELEFLTNKLLSNCYFPLVKKGENAWNLCSISTENKS